MRDYLIKSALHAAFALARANVGLIHRLMVLRERNERSAMAAQLRAHYR